MSAARGPGCAPAAAAGLAARPRHGPQGPASVDVPETIGAGDIHELSDWLAGGRISSEELTRLVLDRLDGDGRALGAVARLLPERALREARAADRRRRRVAAGRAPSRLLGMPYGAKDLLAAIGGATEYGSAAFSGQRLDVDAAAIERLSRSGAVLVAKLSTMELAGYHATRPEASVDGATRNPWDLQRWAGGSSGGSAAAVSARLLPFALGTETGASIGWPSALCGVTGLRPTYGTVSRHGVMLEAWSLDRIGPIGRSARDLGLVLASIRGRDGRDPTTWSPGVTGAAPRARRPRGSIGIKDLRVGLALVDVEESAAPSMRSSLRAAVGAMRDLGVQLVERSLPVGIPYRETIGTIMSAEGAMEFESLIRSRRIDAIADVDQRRRMRASLRLPATAYVRAMAARRTVLQALDALFADVDLLVSFTVPTVAPPITARLPESGPVAGNGSLTAAGNLAGLPALFLPCALSDEGLPVGIQLVGPRRSDALLLELGVAFQAATDWHRLRPSHAARR